MRVLLSASSWLEREWAVCARVLHDRPPAFFRPLPIAERHALYLRLRAQLQLNARGEPLWVANEPNDATTNVSFDPWESGCTPWTVVGKDGLVRMRKGAPRLLVSSTSWSARRKLQ